MKINERFKRCKYCGKRIGIIRERAYRKIIVDAEAVPVIPDAMGEVFIRINGSKMRGKEIKMDQDQSMCMKPEYVYRQHKNCRECEDEV